MNSPNPYVASETSAAVSVQTANRPSVYCVALFGASLFLSLLRLPFVGLAILEVAGGGMGYDAAFAVTVIPSLVAGAGIVLFGIASNGLLLASVRWGIPLAMLLILSVAASIGIEIWAGLIARSLPDYRQTLINDVASVLVPTTRIVFLLLYAGALLAFQRCCRTVDYAQPV